MNGDGFENKKSLIIVFKQQRMPIQRQYQSYNLKMKKESSNKCSSCSKIFPTTLSLDCRHSICLICLQQIIREQEKQERLNDDLQIECPVCNYTTAIAMTLAYKLVRPTRDTEAIKHSNHCKSMVCMNCLDGFFPIDQYLKGHHSSHQVLTLSQAYIKIKDVLFYEQKQMEEVVNRCYLQTEKLVHCKSMLNDIFNANIIKIKVGFENLKEIITKKEMEVLDYYEQSIYRLFNTIDEDIVENKKKVQLCKNHLEWINDNLVSSSESCYNNDQKFETVNYFIMNHEKIDHLNMKYNDQNILYLMEEMEQNRQIVNLQELRKIQKAIRTLQVIRSDEKSTVASSCSLSRQYFEIKRKEVFNFSPQNEIHLQKLRRIKPTTQMQRFDSQKSYKIASNHKKIEDVKYKLRIPYRK